MKPGAGVAVPAFVDVPRVLAAILPGYALDVLGDHGPIHWARVLENGLRLAPDTGADPGVVAYFALFHDARRLSELNDPGHGARGAELARGLRDSCVALDDAAFALLDTACREHTGGGYSGDPTIQTCWDADRLDLGRVDITPDPGRLGSAAARALLGWSHTRATSGHRPEFFALEWLPVIRGLPGRA